MVATPLNPSVRFPGLSNLEFYWCPSIASKGSPTRPELDAGTNLTGEVQTAAGWSTDTALIDAPDLASGFTAQLEGALTAAASSLMIYMSEDDSVPDVRTIFSRGQGGFIVKFPAGDVTGQLCSVFPVNITSMVDSVDSTNPMTTTINYRITSLPAENIVVP